MAGFRGVVGVVEILMVLRGGLIYGQFCACGEWTYMSVSCGGRIYGIKFSTISRVRGENLER